jgi:hypothetical protein
VEPSASLVNLLFKVCEAETVARNLLGVTAEEARTMLIESCLGFCEMTRLCGESDDLLVALAKTGFLEQKFRHNNYFAEVYPAALKERAELLWKRGEKIEAVQTIRCLLNARPSSPLTFSLVPKEILMAKLV